MNVLMSRIGLEVTPVEMIGAQSPSGTEFERVLGNKQFEMSNHLGNVLTVVTDYKVPRNDDGDATTDYYQPMLLSAQDYSPFGVVLEGRDFQSEEYRYGFNGMERDDEVKGGGNSINYKHRMHDPRLGRFFCVDPVHMKFPFISPYNFAENRVIEGVDLHGLQLFVKMNDEGEVTTLLHMENSLVVERMLVVNMDKWNQYAETNGIASFDEVFTQFHDGNRAAYDALVKYSETYESTIQRQRERLQEKRRKVLEAQRRVVNALTGGPGTFDVGGDGPLGGLVRAIGGDEAFGAFYSYDSHLQTAAGREDGLELMFATWGTIISGGLMVEGFSTVSLAGKANRILSFTFSLDKMTQGSDDVTLVEGTIREWISDDAGDAYNEIQFVHSFTNLSLDARQLSMFFQKTGTIGSTPDLAGMLSNAMNSIVSAMNEMDDGTESHDIKRIEPND